MQKNSKLTANPNVKFEDGYVIVYSMTCITFLPIKNDG